MSYVGNESWDYFDGGRLRIRKRIIYGAMAALLPLQAAPLEVHTEEERKEVYRCGTCGWRGEIWVPVAWPERHAGRPTECPTPTCCARFEESFVTEEREPDPDLAEVMEAAMPDPNCKDCHGTGIFDWKKKHGIEGQEPCFDCSWDPSKEAAGRLAMKFIEQGKRLAEAEALLRERSSFLAPCGAVEASWRARVCEFLGLNSFNRS